MPGGWLPVSSPDQEVDGRSASKVKRFYSERREKVPALVREEALNRRLRKHVTTSYRCCEGFREHLRAAGVPPEAIRTVRDLERVPVLSKDDLAAMQRANPPYGGFLGAGSRGSYRVYVTPARSLCLWGPERTRAIVRGLLRWGHPDPGEVVLVSHDYHFLPGGLAFTDALDLMGCIVVPAGSGQVDLQASLLHKLGPTTVFGSPSFVMSLLRKCEELRYDVRRDLKLRNVYCGGERHIQKLRTALEQKYGLIVYDDYGTADVGPIGFCCGAGGGYHFEDESCVVEIVDIKTGRQMKPHELGHVVVTPFSRVYPLIRFGTGDLASFTLDPCSCGRSAPRITAIRGSVDKHIRVKGGFLHLGEIEAFMSGFREIANYQIILRLSAYNDSITLVVEIEPPAADAALFDRISRSCEESLKMRIDAIRSVPSGSLPRDCQRVVDERWDSTSDIAPAWPGRR